MDTFDISRKVESFIHEGIKDKAGNPGQQALIDRLIYGGSTQVQANQDPFSANTNYNTDLITNHPEAIRIILEEAEQLGELIAAQAELPVRGASYDKAKQTQNWIISGYDG